MKDFIKKYFRLLNVKNMPEAVFARYKKYIKDDDFPNKEVKSWAKDLMVPGTTTWQDLPDFSTLSDDDLNKLYIILLETLSDMATHKDKLSNDTKEFVDENYGDKNKPFITPEISTNDKQQIQKLIQLLLNDSDVKDIDLLGYGDDDVLKDVLNGQKKFENNEVRKIIFNVIKNIRQAKLHGYLTQESTPEAYKKLSGFNLDAIQKAVKPFNVDDVSSQNRNDLRTNGAKIFEALYKKNKIFDDFKKYEPGEKVVSEQIDAALSNTDYTGKTNEKNYVPGKYEDNLNLRQKIDKALEDTYSDVLKKYLKLHRANLFIKPEAKAIFEALDKAKIKPTDGLKALIDKKEGQKDNIINSLKGKQPFSAADHLKWMTDKLSDYQNNGMSKAIEAALRNGHQMKHVIEQLAIDAVKEGKVKEAKTAMEVLSVMQYGLFTSRTMDAINKTDMTIFSDGKLSWNNNEGIQFVTKAFDRTLKTGVQLAGYGATAAINAIRRTGSTFDHSGKLNDKALARDAELGRQKADFDSEKVRKDAADNAEIRNNTARRNATGITDLNATKNQLSKDRAIEARRKTVYEGREQQFAAMEAIDKDYTNYTQLKNDIATLLNQANAIKATMVATPNPTQNQYDKYIADKTAQDFAEKEKAIEEKIQATLEIENKYTTQNLDLITEHNRIHTVASPHTQSPYDLAQTKMNNAKIAYENQQNANDALEHNINEYEEATENIDTAKRQISERQDAANNWNKNNKNEYMELMAYWDFLQSGNTKSLFHISTKKLQEKMNAGKMQTMLNDWNRAYAA
jgi:hypothetical protein